MHIFSLDISLIFAFLGKKMILHLWALDGYLNELLTAHRHLQHDKGPQLDRFSVRDLRPQKLVSFIL